MTGPTSVLPPHQALPSLGGTSEALQGYAQQHAGYSSGHAPGSSSNMAASEAPSAAQQQHDAQAAQHPKGKAAVGGQSHAHRPVSAMPAPRTVAQDEMTADAQAPRGSTSANAAGGTAAAAFANIVNNQPYNDRRQSAHPVLTNAPASSSSATATATGGLDAQTASAIASHGIPLTSPAALQYFAAHPRRQQVHFGSYLLLQTLGEGEFGKVKLGVHKEWGEEVAVKLIKRDRVAGAGGSSASIDGKEPGKMSKVEREIQVLKEVRHPNIVRLYEVIESDRYIGIVLEYASGGELFDHILAHKYLREKDACRLFAQLISGVHYLHQKQIIHRDLKLENLLLDRNRNVIITDFGFANNFGDKRNDLMATSCGSPCYAAPELVVQDGLYAGSAVDVWSCGVILYAMLAGYLPFDDDPANPDGDNINLLYKYIMATPLSFPDYITAEPRDLLSKMLVPDPLKRADLQKVMNHSWLAAYRDLFTFSVDDLERAAIEQQAKKRQVYRQQMLLQQQMQEQQQARAKRDAVQASAQAHAPQAAKVQRSDSVRDTASTSSPRSQRHHSAMPAVPSTAAAAPAVAAAATAAAPLGSETTTPTRSRVSSAEASGRTPFDPVAAQGEARGEPRSRISADSDAAATGGKRAAAEPSYPPSARKPAAQKTQRHTIQLEYTGSDPAQQAAQAERNRRREREQQPPSPPVSSIPAKVARSASSASTASPSRRAQPPAEQASPVVVPAAEQAVSAVAAGAPSATALGTDISVPSPVQEAVAIGTKSVKPSASTERRRPVSAIPAPVSDYATSVPFPDAEQPRGSRIVSDTTGSAARRAAKAPGSGNTPPPASSSAAAAALMAASTADAAADRKAARHRKGMSRDNSFFSRLLSSSHADKPNGVTASSSAMEASTSDDGGRSGFRIVSSGSAKGSVKSNGSFGRRKAMSLVVSKFGDANKDRENALAAKEKSERRHTGKMQPKEEQAEQQQRVPLAPTASNTPTPTQSAVRQSSIPRPAQRQPQRHHNDEATGAAAMGSTNAAKKVMDWFRKKSLAKGTFDEQPPLPPFERPAEASAPAAAPRVVVTGSGASAVRGPTPPVSMSGRAAVQQATESSGQSSRSTSGTHSYLSNETHATAESHASSATTVTNASHPAIKGSAPLLQTSSPDPSDTPRGSAAGAEALGLQQRERDPNAPFDDTILRQHVGAVDQTALTSLPPPEVLARVREALTTMGVDFRLASGEEFKLECLRQKRSAKPLQGLGSSIRTSVFPPSQAEIERTSKASSSAMSPSMSSAGSIRSFLRRGSSQQNGIPQSPTVGSAILNGHTIPTLYGEATVDGGQEVRFSVEITKIKNLPGLYSLDIRRMRGNVWAYKFCYTALLQRCNLSGQGIAL